MASGLPHLAFAKLTISKRLLFCSYAIQNLRQQSRQIAPSICVKQKAQKQGEFLRHKRHKSAQKHGKNLAWGVIYKANFAFYTHHS